MLKGKYKLRNEIEVKESVLAIEKIVLGLNGSVEIFFNILDKDLVNVLETRRRMVSVEDQETYFSASVLKKSGKEPFAQALAYLAQKEPFTSFKDYDAAE